MTERRKKILKWVGYPLLGLVVFVFGVHFMFPYERVKERLVEALSKDYDVTITEITPGMFPGRFTITGLALTTRPATELEKPVTLTVDKVDLNVSLLSLLGKHLSVDIDATLGDGSVKGHVDLSDDDVGLDVDTRDLPLESIPGVAVLTGGAPIKGGLEVHFKLDLPGGKWMMANGSIDLSCSACTIGDGVTKVRTVAVGQVNAFNAEGFTLPKIKLGKMVGKISIKQGIACIETFGSSSTHGEIHLEGGMKFADPVAQSQAQLYTRFKLTDEFKAEDPRNGDIEILMGTGARNPDGWTAYQARSPISALRWLPAHTPPVPMRECAGVASPTPGGPAPLAGKPALTRPPIGERPGAGGGLGRPPRAFGADGRPPIGPNPMPPVAAPTAAVPAPPPTEVTPPTPAPAPAPEVAPAVPAPAPEPAPAAAPEVPPPQGEQPVPLPENPPPPPQ